MNLNRGEGEVVIKTPRPVPLSSSRVSSQALTVTGGKGGQVCAGFAGRPGVVPLLIFLLSKPPRLIHVIKSIIRGDGM